MRREQAKHSIQIPMTFYDNYLSNNIEFETIHDEIAQWHSEKSKTSLHEFLGLSFAEYKILVENESKFESYLNYLRKSNGESLFINPPQTQKSRIKKSTLSISF